MIDIPGHASLVVSIVALEKVRPHEKTIPLPLASIRNDMMRTNTQRDPILIDSKTKLAMDGMHRLAALHSLDAKLAVCAEYDYLSRSVKLERWLRYFIAPNKKLLTEISEEFDATKTSDLRKAVSDVDSGRSSFALLSARNSFVSRDEMEFLQTYQKVGKVDRLCEEAGLELQFAPEADLFSLFTSDSVYVIYPPRPTKKDVIRMVENNEVFPYKTTRHIVPIRPMGLYFPLDYLQNRTESECTKKLEEIVTLSKIEVKKVNVWYEGRTYSEPLAIFRRPGD
jgi:L-serine kinase (ADP)